jgi:NUC153 domain
VHCLSVFKPVFTLTVFTSLLIASLSFPLLSPARYSRGKKPKEAEDAALLKDSTSSSGGDFQLDLQDNRFARLLEGDSSFGIDRTSSEFKETKAMKQIFGEQRSRREKNEKEAANASKAEREQKHTGANDVSSTHNVNSLVSKLKRKYSEQSSNKTKSARL